MALLILIFTSVAFPHRPLGIGMHFYLISSAEGAKDGSLMRARD